MAETMTTQNDVAMDYSSDIAVPNVQSLMAGTNIPGLSGMPTTSAMSGVPSIPMNTYSWGWSNEAGTTVTNTGFNDVMNWYTRDSNYSAESYSIDGYSTPTTSVRTQSYSNVNTSSSYQMYNVGDSNGYISDFKSGTGDDAGVLNFQSTDIQSFTRHDDYLNFNMGGDVSFQVQNSSSTNDIIQYTTDGENVSYAKIGYADRDNYFTYEDGVNFYSGSEHMDVLHVDNYESRNIWLDGSQGVTFNNISGIDASTSYGNNTLAGAADMDNEITAGHGNDLLWGGAGQGNDTLVGGTGDNTYFYGNNNGNDVIVNSIATDSINLYDVSLTDIVSADEVGSDFVVNMRGGNSLVIQGQQGASNFILSDQTAYNYNRESHVWTKTA